MRLVPVTSGPVRVSIAPLGLESCMSTISNERSDATRDATIGELNAKAQVKVMSVPTITIPEVPALLVSVRDGDGTRIQIRHI